MNNEPVAYVNSMCNDYIDWKADPMSIDGQPLYTHQYERPHNTVLVPCDKLAEMQAELAILRKAQEK